MNTHKLTALGTLAFSASAFAVAPQLTVIDAVQDANRLVTITYSLAGSSAIVTPSVQTNAGNGVWVDIGDANLTHFVGDVHKIVEAGENRRITWRPNRAWPDHVVSDGNIRVGVKAWALDEPPDYVAASLKIQGNLRFYASADMVPGGVTNDLYKTEYLLMRRIPCGNVCWRKDNANPYEVTLTNDFYIGVYEFTQGQVETLSGYRSSYFSNDADYATRPAEYNAARYSDNIRGWVGTLATNGHDVDPNSIMGKLRAHAGLPVADLPTSAQWEFAARAGCGDELYSGKPLTVANCEELGRIRSNGGYVGGEQPPSDCRAEYGTAKVGSYKPNAFGLYDMIGNVWEVCNDFWSANPQDYDPAIGAPSGNSMFIRGGCFNNPNPSVTYAADVLRGQGWNYVGFRVACSSDFTAR